MQHIFHPTDLGPGSGTAFLHALRMAMVAHTRLTLMHVADAETVQTATLPGVRAQLARWGHINGADDAEGLLALGMGVKKVLAEGEDPVEACGRYLERHPADLLVLATHQRDGRTAWSQARVAEPLARRSGVPTLFVPNDRPGFVEPETGAVRLRRILLPVAKDPDPKPAMEAAANLARTIADAPVDITLLHVGAHIPHLRPPTAEGITWHTAMRTGDVVRAIVQEAHDGAADLLVMTTKGHDGFLDALRGNTTEQVLRKVPCPVLAVTAPEMR